MIKKIIKVSIISLILAIVLAILIFFILKLYTRKKKNNSIKIHHIFLDLFESIIFGILTIFTIIKETLKILFKRKGE
jgi:hypothetical protein